MTHYLSYHEDELKACLGWHTAREITQQPDIWLRVFEQLRTDPTWKPFLTSVLAQKNLMIILTGAGSSAFVGMAVAPWLREQTGLAVHNYATTDIVVNPHHYFRTDRPTLLISYARSGNSPESVAVVQLADQLIDSCFHLIITCNPDSALTHHVRDRKTALSILMPEGTNDVSFAMTSSMTSMMLATILMLGFEKMEDARLDVLEMIRVARKTLCDGLPLARTLAAEPASRLLYIGSGCFAGIARESALKSLELTGGKIATYYDSTLGLRHGPKFIIDTQTLIVLFFSNEPYQRHYDQDLFAELTKDGIACRLVGVSVVVWIITQRFSVWIPTYPISGYSFLMCYLPSLSHLKPR